jgi:hypothetical protein
MFVLLASSLPKATLSALDIVQGLLYPVVRVDSSSRHCTTRSDKLVDPVMPAVRRVMMLSDVGRPWGRP